MINNQVIFDKEFFDNLARSGENMVISFGGVGDYEHSELGGVQLLFILNGTMIGVDYGQRPDHFNRFWSFPRSPRKYDILNISDLMDLYASIPGVFRMDYEWHRGRFCDHPTLGRYIPENPLDGMIFTHSHYDHVAGVTLLRPDMPIYTHALTTLMLYFWQYSSGRSINQFVDLIDQFSTIPNLQGKTKFINGEEAVIPRDYRAIENGVPFYIKDIKITPYLVDHSVPGAMGFIMETEFGNIGISGDIRLRGRRMEDTENFIQACIKHKVKYLFWEGSLLHFEHNGKEEDVSEEVAKRLKGKDFAVIAFPPRELERMTSLYEACKATGRTLVLTAAQANLLRAFGGINGYPEFNSKHVAYMLPPKNKGLIDRGDEFSQELIERDYFYAERPILKISRWDGPKKKPQRVSLEDIANNQDQFLVYFPMQYFDLLPRIFAKTNTMNNIYIRSHPGPWTKDMEIQEAQQINYLQHYGMYIGPQPDVFATSIMRNILQIHITGHMNREETRDVLSRIREATNCTLIPYHTMNPQEFVNDVYKGGDIMIPTLKEKMIFRKAA